MPRFEELRKYILERRRLGGEVAFILDPQIYDELVDWAISKAIPHDISEIDIRAALAKPDTFMRSDAADYDIEDVHDAIYSLSLSLFEKVIERDEMVDASPVRSHRRIEDSLVNELICLMLEATAEDQEPIAYPLIELIRYQLGRHKEHLTITKNLLAREKAAIIISGLPATSNREIARALRVDHKTIRKWKDDGAFQEMVAKYDRAFEKNNVLARRLLGSGD